MKSLAFILTLFLASSGDRENIGYIIDLNEQLFRIKFQSQILKIDELMDSLRIKKPKVRFFRDKDLQMLNLRQVKVYIEEGKNVYSSSLLFYNSKLLFVESCLDQQYWESNQKRELIHRKIDSTLMKQFSKEYYQLYGTQPNIEDLNPSLYNCHEGLSCGCNFGGYMPDHALELRKLIVNNNSIDFSNWLVSINPHKRAYGYVGTMLMEKKGRKLSEREILVRNQFIKEKIILEYCSGCEVHVTGEVPFLIQKYVDILDCIEE